MRQVQAQEGENIALRTLIAHAQNELREAVLVNTTAPPPPAHVPASVTNASVVMPAVPITATAVVPHIATNTTTKPRQPTPSAAVTANITDDKSSRHISSNRLKSPLPAAPIKTHPTTAALPTNTDDDDLPLWGSKGPKKGATTATAKTAATTTTAAAAVNKAPSEDEWVQWSAPNRGPTAALSQSNKTYASQKGTSTAHAPAVKTTVDSATAAASTYVGQTPHVTKPSLKPRSLKPDLPAPRNQNGNKATFILRTIYFTICSLFAYYHSLRTERVAAVSESATRPHVRTNTAAEKSPEDDDNMMTDDMSALFESNITTLPSQQQRSGGGGTQPRTPNPTETMTATAAAAAAAAAASALTPHPHVFKKGATAAHTTASRSGTKPPVEVIVGTADQSLLGRTGGKTNTIKPTTGVHAHTIKPITNSQRQQQQKGKDKSKVKGGASGGLSSSQGGDWFDDDFGFGK